MCVCVCVCVSMDLEFCACASGLNGCMYVCICVYECVCVCGFLSVVRVRLSIQPKCVYYLQLTYSTYIAGPLLAPCQPFPFFPIPLHNLPFPFPMAAIAASNERSSQTVPSCLAMF